jgi:hypothetical protein
MSTSPAARTAVPADPWRILRWRTRLLAYREELAPGVAITLPRIPAGSFWMGAPDGEEGGRARERPVSPGGGG